MPLGLAFLILGIMGALAILGHYVYQPTTGKGGVVLERRGKNYDYLLIRPHNVSDSDLPRPLLIFLHGSGEIHKNLRDLRHGSLVRYANAASNKDDFPFIVVCPKGDGPIWEPDCLIAFLDELLAGDPAVGIIDPARVYLTGFSLGGYGTWQTAAQYPDRFAAVVPVAGDSNPAWAKSFGSLPVWAFHGEKDRAVHPNPTVETIAAIREFRGEMEDIRLTLYPEIGHEIEGMTYRNPELYQWLLRHRSEK